MRQTAFQRAEVLHVEHRLLGTALHFQGTNRRDQYRGFRIQAASAALDIQKLLRAQVRAETGLGDHHIAEGKRGSRCDQTVAAVRDIPEWSRVHQCRATFERLHQIGPKRIPEQERHGACSVQVARTDGSFRGATCRTDDDIAEPFDQIFGIGGKRENRHDLAGGDNDPALFTHGAVSCPDADDRAAECAVVHVDRARPGDALDVELERIAVVEMVVHHRRQQRVRARNRVEVTREMQIDVIHRQHLRVAAAGCAALHAKHRPKTRLAYA